MGDDEYVVLGGDVAAVGRRGPVDSSPLAGLAYPPAAGRLWRWTAAAQDAPLSRFVQDFTRAAPSIGDPRSRPEVRAALSAGDLRTLLLFARRRALAAIRTRDARAVGDAFDALAAIDVSRVDRRDVVVAAVVAAFAARAAGVAAATVAAGAADRATPEVAAILRHAAGKRKIDLADETGLRLVVTADGPVLVDDGLGHYRPVRDLLPVVLGIDAVLTAEGSYRTGRVTVADAPPENWVGAESPALNRLTGCASLHAEAVNPPARGGRPDSLAVHVVETRTDRAAYELAGAADRRLPTGAVVLGVAAGRLCAVLVVRNVRAGAATAESRMTMGRFRPAITEVLLRAR